MKSRFLIAVVAVLGYAIIDGTSADAATDKYFKNTANPGSPDVWVGGGSWHSASCTGDIVGDPSRTETVTICANETVEVVSVTAVAELVVVETGALIELDPRLTTNAILTLGDGDADQISTLTGDIFLKDDADDGTLFARLAFYDPNNKNHWFKRTTATTGDIVGEDNLAELVSPGGSTIKIYDSAAGTNCPRVIGHLKITGSGVFQNECQVIADADGTLDMLASTIDDSSGSCRWKVMTSSSAKLLFSISPAALAGDFCVEKGTLEAGISGDTVAVDTSGCLTHGPAGEIVVGQNDSFMFCPAVRP